MVTSMAQKNAGSQCKKLLSISWNTRVRKRGGDCAVVKDTWCNPGHIKVKEQRCGRGQPAILPAKGVFTRHCDSDIHPSLGQRRDTACKPLHRVVAQLQTDHPQAFVLITGDLNLSAMLPNFQQYVAPGTVKLWTCCMQTQQVLLQDFSQSELSGKFSC